MSEQQVNSLDRFRKKSPSLVLEEHSHCEVPAGCGGVVLRWRNPHATLALRVHLYSPANSTLQVDGQPIENTRLDISPGEHVFAITLRGSDLSAGLFMFAALHDPKQPYKHMPTQVSEAEWRLISAANESWRVLTEAPVEHNIPWTSPGYDDSTWATLSRVVPSPEVEWREPGAHQAYRCNQANAAFLALHRGTTGTGEVWIRRRFVIPAPITT